MPRGIVIEIKGDGSSAKQALEMVQEQLRRTEEASDRATGTYGRLGTAVGHSVPPMAAASAALRALEGGFSNNIRAGERFLSMLPGIPEALSTAFPAIGLGVLATAFVTVGMKAYDAFENIVMCKGALEELGQLDISVAKHLQTNADAIERSTEQVIEATQGHAASLKQRLSYDSGKAVDLSELFYDKDFKDQKSNVKANYETLYKSVAPADLPKRLQQIRSEVTSLNQALDTIRGKQTGAFVPMVGGYGPGLTETPEKYYEKRLKAAKDIEAELASEAQKRDASLAATTAEMNKPQKSARVAAVRSDDPIMEARERLAEEQAKALAERTKANDEQQIGELETLHKMLLVGDQEYYAEKQRLETEAFDAEQTALTARRSTLAALYQSQHADKTLKRDKDGNSAEELKTQTRLLEVDQQIDALKNRRGAAANANTLEVNAANQAAELANLKAAADLERARNVEITAQIALIRREHELEAQKATSAGGSQEAADQIRALGEVQVKQLEIGQVSKQIAETEEEYQLRSQAVSDRMAKGLESKMQGEHELNALHAAEVQALAALVAQYDALAAVLGGEFKVKAEELHATLSKLSTPDQKQEGQFGKTIAEGVTSMADRIAEQALRGKTAFKEMAREIETDAIKLALKLALMRFLNPAGAAGGGAGGGTAGGGGFWQQIGAALGKAIPGFADGTDGAPGGLAMVGEEGPELVNLPKGSAVTPNAGLTKLAETSGNARVPNITSNVINQTSNPVTAQPSQVDYDEQSKSYIIRTILEDHAQGGPIRQAFAGG